jgi:UDP-3-O-[3-hydroxymyristoyl] glucosamine N-acyltransferase
VPISLGELAIRHGCDLKGEPDVVVDNVASLQRAGSGSVSFYSNPALAPQLAGSKAAAVILRAEDIARAPNAALISENPYATFARIARELYPPPALSPGIHPTAIVGESANIAASAEISAFAIIGANSTVGEHVFIGPGTVVGEDCNIGDACRLLANVTFVRKVCTGERCLFHPGAVIGADGFGNAMTSEGWVKVPQLGGVRIGNDVEVGANSTIDCGALEDTVIGDGVRIDNLCMIAHNVYVGAHTAIAAMTGIAGSAVIGERCLFAGQAGCVGHVTICDDVVISAKGMVSKDISEPGVYASNFPVEPVRKWNRLVARFRRIESLSERIKNLEEGQS